MNADWTDPDSRESLIAKKWAEAEDKLKRLRRAAEDFLELRTVEARRTLQNLLRDLES